MKKGILVIIQNEDHFVAAIKRADGVKIPLDIPVTDEIRKLDGEPCEYLLKGDKVVTVMGKDIYKLQKQEPIKHEIATKKNTFGYKAQLRKASESISSDEIEKMEMPPWSRNDSFDLKQARVPKDTRELVINKTSIDNFSLKLNRFARFEENFNENNKTWDRKFLFIKGKSFRIQQNFGTLFTAPAQISNRLTSAATKLFSNEGQLMILNFKPEWRFVTGLGGENVYETGITLHHIYGVPFIPASTIKGVLRSWIIFSNFNNNEGEAISDKAFCEVFGCPVDVLIEKNQDRKRYKSVFEEARKGKLTFFDALPITSPVIEPDIMNPHYPDWYSGKAAAPTDSQKPNPVFFLTVKETVFQFLMASKVFNLETKTFWQGETLGWWLENALAEHGIGAKTAVGYGFMKTCKD